VILINLLPHRGRLDGARSIFFATQPGCCCAHWLLIGFAFYSWCKTRIEQIRKNTLLKPEITRLDTDQRYCYATSLEIAALRGRAGVMLLERTCKVLLKVPVELLNELVLQLLAAINSIEQENQNILITD
jgi:hypothetical protein